MRSGSEIVEENIARFKAAGVKRIITVCPGCYAAFNKYYKGEDGFDPEVVLAVDLLDGMSAPGEGFVVQDPCHAKEKGEAVRTLAAGRQQQEREPVLRRGRRRHDPRPAAG